MYFKADWKFIESESENHVVLLQEIPPVVPRHTNIHVGCSSSHEFLSPVLSRIQCLMLFVNTPLVQTNKTEALSQL